MNINKFEIRNSKFETNSKHEFLNTEKNRRGFTLAELLMAIWVMGIILGAVAALAYSLGTANDMEDNTSDVYSRIRYTTFRISEIMRSGKLICANSGTSVAIWLADYNGDNKIEPNEIVYLESSGGNINLVSFQPSGAAAGTVLLLANIKSGQARTWLAANSQVSSITLVNNCNSVYFMTDQSPPSAKQLNILFSITQKGTVRQYQISDKLRCHAGYLLDSNGLLKTTDDD
jgi:prepilin-type N-terminal cleavage/methylation domain-containing protein